MMRWTVCGSLLALLGSACLDPGQTVLEPAPDAPAAWGERGPYGVRLYRRDLRGRVDQAVPTDVFVPEATADLDTGPFAPVLLVQGGLVSVERYHWLGVHLASRGSVVLAPHHVGDLALFEQGQAVDALHAARRAALDPRDVLHAVLGEQPGLAVGHSLGGVVATKAWLDEPAALHGLVLLASLPDPGDDLSVRRDGRVLSVSGTRNSRTSSAEFLAAARTFDAPICVAFVRGMNHYQFTDNATASELASDGTAEIELEPARRLSLFLVDALLDETRGRASAIWSQPRRWPEGLLAPSEVLP